MVKTLFYGTPAFALPTLQRLIDSPHPVVAVITQPDRPRGRGRRVSASPVKQLATAHDIPVLEPTRARSETLQRTVSSFGADLAVVAAYGKILPDALLDTPRLGTINVHASLLPRYRGAAPIQRAILAGDTTTGVTIIRLVAEMDAGPMLARGTVPIGPTETSIVVEHALSRLGADLLLKTLAALERGDATETEQDHVAATYAPRLTRDDGVIDWTRPACAIHDQIRGLHPWPHASSVLAGKRFLIHQSRPLDQAASHGPRQRRPGKLIEATGDRLVVATGEDTSLAIVEIQPEGRRPVPVRAFLAGHRWTVGLRFDVAPR